MMRSVIVHPRFAFFGALCHSVAAGLKLPRPADRQGAPSPTRRHSPAPKPRPRLIIPAPSSIGVPFLQAVMP